MADTAIAVSPKEAEVIRFAFGFVKNHYQAAMLEVPLSLVHVLPAEAPQWHGPVIAMTMEEILTKLQPNG